MGLQLDLILLRVKYLHIIDQATPRLFLQNNNMMLSNTKILKYMERLLEETFHQINFRYHLHFSNSLLLMKAQMDHRERQV